MAVIIYEALGYRLIDVNTALKDTFINLKNGQNTHIEFQLHNILLKPGTYLIGLWLGRANVEDIDGITYVTSFVVESDLELIEHATVYPGPYQCRFSINLEPFAKI